MLLKLLKEREKLIIKRKKKREKFISLNLCLLPSAFTLLFYHSSFLVLFSKLFNQHNSICGPSEIIWSCFCIFIQFFINWNLRNEIPLSNSTELFTTSQNKPKTKEKSTHPINTLSLCRFPSFNNVKLVLAAKRRKPIVSSGNGLDSPSG